MTRLINCGPFACYWKDKDWTDQVPKPPPVLTKTDFARRYKAGEFGNSSPTWNDFDEWDMQCYPPDQLFHVRNRIAGAHTWYDVSLAEMWFVWHKACIAYAPEHLYISAMCPTERTLIQGEVMRWNRELEFYYTTVKKPMRDALKEQSQTAYGITAKNLLLANLNTASYEWLQHLLDVYPDHVVEITALDCCWGTEPGFNTLYWEVRRY